MIKRITHRWMTVAVVFVVATQCCCCIVTPVSGPAVQAAVERSWTAAAETAVETAAVWFAGR